MENVPLHNCNVTTLIFLLVMASALLIGCTSEIHFTKLCTNPKCLESIMVKISIAFAQ